MRAKMGFKAKLQGSRMVVSFLDWTIFSQAKNIIRNSYQKSENL